MLVKISSVYFMALTFILFTLAAKAEVVTVTLLHTNDIESVYEPLEAKWRDDITLIGGMPYLATLVRQITLPALGRQVDINTQY